MNQKLIPDKNLVNSKWVYSDGSFQVDFDSKLK